LEERKENKEERREEKRRGHQFTFLVTAMHQPYLSK